MKSIILPCTPIECVRIANGNISVLVRKRVPNESNLPIKVFIYCIKPRKEYQHICGCLVLNSDQLYKHPTQGIKYGDSIELMACDSGSYSRDNFLNGKVIGEFVCNEVKKYEPHVILCAYYEVNGADVKEDLRYNKGTCLSYDDMVKRSNGKTLYGLHITDLKIYDKPKILGVFYAKCNIPESKCKLCDNCFEKENGYGKDYAVKQVTRPPKNYIYVEE